MTVECSGGNFAQALHIDKGLLFPKIACQGALGAFSADRELGDL